MAKSTNYWDKRAIKRMTDAEKSSEVYIKRIKKIYEQAYRNIDGEIARIYKNYSKETGLDTQKLKELLSKKETDKTWKTLKRQGLDKYVKDNYKARISRLEQLQAQIYAKAKQIYPKEELENTMCYKGVINDSYYKAVYDTQMGTGYDFSFNKIDNNMLNAILNEKWSGKNYSQRIWTNTDILADSVSQIVGGGLLSGQSIQKTAKQIRDRFNVGKYYSERLVRTETNHFNNEADAMAYEEMGVKEYVFVAVLDNRTSEICQDHDNKKFKYSEREVGVNYPPLHPNCRSTTRGYLGAEAEKTLQRRAKNPITGKTELIDNISYKEWSKQNDIPVKENTTKVVKPKPIKKTQAKVTKTKNDVKINITDLPTEFSTKKEIDNTKTVLDFINSQKNANSKVVQLYKNMGKYQHLPFKISHAKDHSLKKRVGLKIVRDIKLTIPNIDKENIGNINTWLHENMHFIDLIKKTTDVNNYKGMFSTTQMSLQSTIRNTDASMSNDVKELFTTHNNKCKDIQTSLYKERNKKLQDLNNKYSNNDIKYKDYRKEYTKIKNNYNNKIDIEQRNLMGGVEQLEDIYDALSKGTYRDTGVVLFGHGSKTYSTIDSRVKEIVANYSSLSISRPDLVEMLRQDKPNLVKELDNLIDKMLEG